VETKAKRKSFASGGKEHPHILKMPTTDTINPIERKVGSG
jgi:hypothetical protein